MSRFDILRAEYEKWHDDAWSVQISWRRLPYVLANAMRTYLGAPEKFVDISTSDNAKTHSYVTPADAVWKSATSNFSLSISEKGAMMRDFELHENDGRYYFGMVIFLDRAPNSFPKQPFWFLFSLGWVGNDFSQLRLQRTQQDFQLSTRSYSVEDLEPICASIEKILREDLSTSPFSDRQNMPILSKAT